MRIQAILHYTNYTIPRYTRLQVRGARLEELHAGALLLLGLLVHHQLLLMLVGEVALLGQRGGQTPELDLVDSKDTYCWRTLFRHPSRLEESLNNQQQHDTSFEEQGI